MKKLLIVGCSYTKGYGLIGEDKNKFLWTNQLHNLIWSDHSQLNLAQPGKNNEWIFLEAMGALSKDHYDTVLIAWSEILRFNFNLGFELYTTFTRLVNDKYDIGLNDGTIITAKRQQKIGDQLRILLNDHWYILNLIKYVNVLIEIQKQRNANIWFVNSLLPWSRDFFTKKQIKFPSELTLYEQNLLSVYNRDDEEIIKLYNKMHDQYLHYGGIRENYWLNLYDSLLNIKIDVVSKTDPHPGLLSQDVFVNKLKQRLI